MFESFNFVIRILTFLLVVIPLIAHLPNYVFSRSTLSNDTSSTSEENKSCEDTQYENRNAFEVETLPLRTIKGVARDRNGHPIPQVCVGVFNEGDHRLIAATETDMNGRFEFKGIPFGYYRLVGKFNPFLTANARINLTPNAPRKKLLLILVLNEIDAGSAFELK